MKKFMSFILISILLLGILTSCGNNSSAPDNTDKNNTAASTAADNAGDAQSAGDSATETRVNANLPEKDFGGYTFTFLAHHMEYAGDWTGDAAPLELVAEEENGDPINDAVYRRNMTIKDKYNIDIKMIDNTSENSLMKKAVNAGDDIYDAAVIFNNNVPTAVTSNLLVNVNKLTYIDSSKPWWDPAVNSMSIDHKNYLLCGDLFILDKEATNIIVFNKDLLANLAIDLPYNLVKEGKWTTDKLSEMVKGTSSDLNGDGVMGVDDRWGFGIFNDTLHAFLVSGGGALAVKDDNDIPYMDFASDKNLNILNKAMDLLYNKDEVINQQGTGGFDTHVAFQANKIVFLWGRMHLVTEFRSMESNFGIAPMPKYDESQANYYSLVNPYTGVLLGVPKSVQDLDRASIILEALSAESRYTLQPTYYDVVLTRKYVRDDESGEMLDIIFSSTVYDIGGVYSFGNVYNNFIVLTSKYDRNITSFYDANIDKMNSAISKVVDTFQSMD
ncbi:MAG: extracellular solute-binding protein [Oscillospiraceae bacterium]|nr:extracellular solute-binding protein [Oscillospiraceae bacterium]